DDAVSLDALLADPFAHAEQGGGAPHPRIPLPPDLYGNERANARGLDLNDETVLRTLDTAFAGFGQRRWEARPLLALPASAQATHDIVNPADRRDTVGQVVQAL